MVILGLFWLGFRNPAAGGCEIARSGRDSETPAKLKQVGTYTAFELLSKKRFVYFQILFTHCAIELACPIDLGNV